MRISPVPPFTVPPARLITPVPFSVTPVPETMPFTVPTSSVRLATLSGFAAAAAMVTTPPLVAATLLKRLFRGSVMSPVPRSIKLVKVVPLVGRMIGPVCVIPFPKSLSTPLIAKYGADGKVPIAIGPEFRSPMRTFVARTMLSSVARRSKCAGTTGAPARLIGNPIVLCIRNTVAAIPVLNAEPPIWAVPSNVIVSPVIVAIPVVSRRVLVPRVTAPAPASTERRPAPEFKDTLFARDTPAPISVMPPFPVAVLIAVVTSKLKLIAPVA